VIQPKAALPPVSTGEKIRDKSLFMMIRPSTENSDPTRQITLISWRWESQDILEYVDRRLGIMSPEF